MITWVASYPRSGNNFFRLVLKHLYGAAFSGLNDEPRLRRAAGVGDDCPLDELLDRLASSPKPYFLKTHRVPVAAGRPPRLDDYPAIYLVRDGRDSAVSFARWLCALDEDRGHRPDPSSFRRYLHEIVTSERRFGGWGANVTLWTERPRTVVVRFERLIATPLETVREALAAAGYAADRPPNLAAPPTFAELRQRDPRKFRRGVIGSWKTELPADLEELFWQRYGAVMEALGYPRA